MLQEMARCTCKFFSTQSNGYGVWNTDT